MRPFAVLFDLDGTLIDSIGLIVAAMEYAYGDREQRPPVAEWLAAIGTPLDVSLQNLRLELFFPADDATATWFRAAAS